MRFDMQKKISLITGLAALLAGVTTARAPLVIVSTVPDQDIHLMADGATHYKLDVRFDNRPLNGEQTNWTEWKVGLPSFVNYSEGSASLPSSNDFFDGYEMYPNNVDSITSNLRMTKNWGLGVGPVNREGVIGTYLFTINTNAPIGEVQEQDRFWIYDTDIGNDGEGLQPFTPDNRSFKIFSPNVPTDFSNPRDGDVDNSDFAVFDACRTGPNIPYNLSQLPSGCTCGTYTTNSQNYLRADFDHDGDVDIDDYGIFQRCYSGNDVPADPNCAIR